MCNFILPFFDADGVFRQQDVLHGREGHGQGRLQPHPSRHQRHRGQARDCLGKNCTLRKDRHYQVIMLL